VVFDMGEQRLPNPYRSLRGTAAGGEVPWRGSIAHAPDGARVLVVDAEDLPELWPGWSASADDHVMVPIDIIRTRTSHLAVLPLCSARLDDVLDRRAASAMPFLLGETVTVCVSVLRGLAGVRRQGIDVPGQWWVDEAGRPLLALGVGSEPATDACARLVERLAQDLDATTARVLDALCDEPRATAFRYEAAEAALFALAPAEPLAHAVFPSRAGGSSFDALLTPRSALSVASAEHTADGPSAPATPWAARLARHVDADVADHVSRVTTAVWRTLRAKRTDRVSSRRGAWGMAAASALVVVGVGMLWPYDTTGSAHGAPGSDDGAGAAIAVPAPSETPSGAVPTLEEADPDPAGIVDALLSARAACRSDLDCVENLMADPAATLSPGVIDLPTDERTVHLVDEFGGVAVVRVDAEDAPSQLVVIERRNDRWLLRDAYDIAQQP
jgi:hypothetical protein